MNGLDYIRDRTDKKTQWIYDSVEDRIHPDEGVYTVPDYNGWERVNDHLLVNGRNISLLPTNYEKDQTAITTDGETYHFDSINKKWNKQN